jgi:hypothetical protein
VRACLDYDVFRERDVMPWAGSRTSSGMWPTRKDGPDPHLADFHLRQAEERGGDELAERIADAVAPFWGRVHEALRAHERPSPAI